MARAKKSKKSKRKSKFPHQLTISNCSSAEEKRIITDAGFETIDCQSILKYFSLEEVFNYWECYFDFEDVESESEIEQYEQLSNTNYYSWNAVEQQDFLNSLILQFSWLPTLFDVATARAVYGLEYRWVKVLAPISRYDGLDCIDSYETEAIKLGLALKRELDLPDLSVINDNKHAVANINGIISFDSKFIRDFIDFSQGKPEVFWSPRKYVKSADRLGILDATKVFLPDEYLFEEDYFY